MTDPQAEGQRWLRYATEDLATAEGILVGPAPNARHACYLAQQAAEKALKSVLVYLQLEYPFTHDLDLVRPAKASCLQPSVTNGSGAFCGTRVR